MVTILAVLTILGSTPQVTAANRTDLVVAELRALEPKVEAAWLAGDARFLQDVLADDMRFTHGRGAVQNKSEFLNELRGGAFLARDLDMVEVELHGDVATTTGRIHVRTVAAEYTIFYVRLYAKRDSRWLLLSHRTIRRVDGPLPK